MTDIIKSPNDYISHYTEKLKNELELYDLDVNYFGFIGFILHMLGWGRFDSTQFYEYLFKEAFTATANKDENLNLHGSVFNHQPSLATPPTAVGSIEFDFNNIIKFNSTTMEKREIYFGTQDKNVYFDIDKYRFQVKSQYIFHQTESNIKTIVINPNGQINHIPSSSTLINVPLTNTQQYSTSETELSLPHYTFNSHYHHTIDLHMPFLSDIEVFIKESHKSDFEQYEYKFVKFLEDGDSKSVFLQRPSATKFLLEFGSGIHGKWVANSDVQLIIYQTYGDQGNLSYDSEYNIKVSDQIQMITYYKNGTIQTQKLSPKLFKIKFLYSEGGKDMFSGEALRDEVIRHIQSRKNLINNVDFYNIYKDYYPKNDFKFMFRKIGPVDNTFYLYNVFRNRYMDIIKTTNKTQQVMNYDEITITNIQANATQTSTGRLIPGEYIYQIAVSDSFGRSKFSTIACLLESPNNTIEITWDDLSTTINMSEYIIYGRTFNNYIYKWTSVNNLFNDYGNDDIDIQNPTQVVYNSESSLLANTYTYKICGVTNSNYTNVHEFSNVTTDSTNNTVELNWDTVDDVSYYMIFREETSKTIFWNIFDTQFIDDGTNQNYFVVNQDGENQLIEMGSQFNNIIEKPIFGNMISPFIYKYDTFFNRYDGYFQYDNFIKYFNEFKIIEPQYIPPNIYLNLIYNINTHTTSVFVKTHQDISGHELYITIEKYNVINEKMNVINDNTQVYIINDILTEEINIIIEEPSKFIANTNDFTYIIDISDILSLFIYSNDNHNYICAIPCMDLNTYNNDSNLYLERIYNSLIENSVSLNRMQSDHIQMRFLETNYIDCYYTERTLKANYNINIQLPLKLNIIIYINTNNVSQQNINLNQKRDDILLSVANFLNDKATGVDISFYNSQLIDLIHTDHDFIKSVDISVKDTDDNLLNDGLETYKFEDICKNILSTQGDMWSNVVTTSETKIKLLDYSPIFWYWDYDEIDIQMKF